MHDDGRSFQVKANIFLAELINNTYPSANTLAQKADCSRSTAYRVIGRLQNEYGIPLAYDNSRKGFSLTDRNYCMPNSLPPGKDELTAFLLACSFLHGLDLVELEEKLQSLWFQLTAGNHMFTLDLLKLNDFFSCDSTVIADIADRGLIEYVQYAAQQENVRVRYKSPWRMGDDKEYQGRILKVHYHDGTLYLLFHEQSGKQFVLNTSFVKEIGVLTTPLEILPAKEEYAKENWLEGYGIFAGENLQEVQICILPPAAEYYATQRWAENQEDRWEGNVLVRTLSAQISPELVRRVMSLGRFVGQVTPVALAEAVKEEIMLMRNNFS